MTRLKCAEVLELLPDFASGRLAAAESSAVDEHVAGCESCADEVALVRVLYAARPRAPEGLTDQVMVALRRSPRRAHRPWWGLSAAAVAALAIGIGIASEHGTVRSTDGPEVATEFEEGELWVSDDGLLAGAPSLDGLSDEALLELLDELSDETRGGSA